MSLLPEPRPDALAVFLDVDGTLVAIAPSPDAVTVPADLINQLQAAHQALSGAMALVSGRMLEDVDRLFAPLRLPAAGLHGLEMRLETEIIIADGARAAPLDAEVKGLKAQLVEWPGVLIEDKGLTVAIHYRQAEEAKTAVREAMSAAAARLGAEFHLLEGKMMYELKPITMDKGRAVAEMMARQPFTGRRPVYFGDDLTDEDAFVVVNRAGGLSVRIGSDEDTVASITLPDRGPLLEWLERLGSQGADRTRAEIGQ